MIEARHFGNVSHFLNHSVCVQQHCLPFTALQCAPNLISRMCWIECQARDLPHVVFFAQRNIVAGEQLSFHYSHSCGVNIQNPVLINDRTNVSFLETCHCGAKNCRKTIYA
jgi:SET domain-containing protein